MTEFLKENYNEVYTTNEWVLSKGDIDILLVAHLDTVNEHYSLDYYKDKAICLYDKEIDLLHVVGGCTLDDRLGIYSIIQIIKDGYKPHILFTTNEEIGGLGVKDLLKIFPKAPFNIKFIIELDRQGKNDAVYYECTNKKFKNYINSFGFKTQIGSFSDCLLLGTQWNIASVNLSCGYLEEHTPFEIGHLKWTHKTIEKVKRILSDTSLTSFYYKK